MTYGPEILLNIVGETFDPSRKKITDLLPCPFLAAAYVYANGDIDGLHVIDGTPEDPQLWMNCRHRLCTRTDANIIINSANPLKVQTLVSHA